MERNSNAQMTETDCVLAHRKSEECWVLFSRLNSNDFQYGE